MSTSFSDPTGITGPYFGGYVEQVINPEGFPVSITFNDDGTIDLAWDPQTSARFYRVYCGASQINMRLLQDNLLTEAYTLSGLDVGVQYYLQVVAVDTSRASTASQQYAVIPVEAPQVAYHYAVTGCPTVFDNINIPWAVGETYTAAFTDGEPAVPQAIRSYVNFTDTPQNNTSTTLVVTVDGAIAPVALPVYYYPGQLFITNVVANNQKTIVFSADTEGAVTWTVS